MHIWMGDGKRGLGLGSGSHKRNQHSSVTCQLSKAQKEAERPTQGRGCYCVVTGVQRAQVPALNLPGLPNPLRDSGSEADWLPLGLPSSQRVVWVLVPSSCDTLRC